MAAAVVCPADSSQGLVFQSVHWGEVWVVGVGFVQHFRSPGENGSDHAGGCELRAASAWVLCGGTWGIVPAATSCMVCGRRGVSR